MHDEPWRGAAEAVAGLPTGSEHGVAIRRIGDVGSWERNSGRRFPAASTIKLAILVATARAIDAGAVSPEAIVPVRPESRVPGSGVVTWLRDDLPLTTGDLAYLMIAISDNTASNALIDLVGNDAIDATISALGLTATELNRRFIGRLPQPGEPDNWTSAADLVTLLAAIAADSAASPKRCRWMRDLLALQQHRDRLPRSLPATVTFAGKSGSLPGIVHDAGLLTGRGGTVAVAVLTEGVADEYALDAPIGQIGFAVAGCIS